MKYILVIALVISATAAYNTLDLPYQAHSMNDLDLTIQELVKGVINFKFDVSQATQESCENQSNWDRDYSQCGYYGDFGMKTCCLALRGDCSQQPVFNYHFNTTGDMIALISNPKYTFLFSKDTPIQKYQNTKYFAFNFQYGARNASFTTDFIYSFLKTIEDKNLNIKMVTGTSGLVFYYDDKCIKQKACNEKEQYISQSEIILQDDVRGVRDRSIQFNIESTLLPKFCLSGFPSYMKNGEIPFQFWEPSYQDSVYDVFDRFWGSRCIKIGVNEAQERFTITSNVNSENYATFLQKANETLKVEYVPEKYRFNNSTHSVIDYNNDLGLTFISRQNTMTQNYELSIYDKVQFQHSTGKSLIFTSPITKLSSKGSFLLVETLKQLNAYSIVSQKEIKLIKTINKESDYICSDIILINNNAYLAISSLQNSMLEVKLVEVNTDNILLSINQPINNVQASGFKYVSSIFNNGNIVQIYTYESINQSNNISEIQYFYHTIQLDNQQSSLVQPSSPLNYGSHSSLKIEEFDGKLYFIQVSGDGSCWSGVFINNGDWCKCTLYSQDKFINLRNVPHTITYMWGRVEDLVDRIKSSTFINSCDKRILSAKVYNGKRPQITVIRDQQNRPTAYVMMDYTHYNELPLLTTLFLGANSYEQEYADIEDHRMTELISFDLLENQNFDLPF